MKNNLRKDLKLISELINSNEKVLDIGCGDGNLLSHLMKIKKVECRGIELSQTGVKPLRVLQFPHQVLGHFVRDLLSLVLLILE